MTDTLIQRLRDEAFLVLSPKAKGTIDVVDIDDAISALEQQAAQIAEKDAEIASLKDAVNGLLGNRAALRQEQPT